MELYSTKHKSPNVGLKEAVITGLPPDNGLYVPVNIPRMSTDYFDQIDKMSFREIAFEVSKVLLKDEVSQQSLKEIITDAFNFPTPINSLEQDLHVLELFHGPTLAFKDYGARFMSRLMSYFLKDNDDELHILVATSGDTGGAVGHGFLDVEGIKVTILYPKGKVSEIQEKQLTTLGHNVSTIEIDGNFDDCQHLVKSAFLDKELNQKLKLTSANSINIARLIPQSFYYHQIYAKLKNNKAPIAVSVPSGNFGNLCGGLLAYKMGLPIDQFIASTNANDIVPVYLRNGIFSPKPSVKTISNAMDVGNPSNFPRILAILDEDINLIKDKIKGYSFSDEDTKLAMKEAFHRYDYVMCPHTAVAYLGLKKWMSSQNQNFQGVLLSTAHPSKFLDVVVPVIHKNIPLDERLAAAFKQEKLAKSMSGKFEEFKSYLLEE